MANKILMGGKAKLRLGPRVLEFLLKRYQIWNQSIEEFISGIKVFFLEMG
jgi:hypothetical protein